MSAKFGFKCTVVNSGSNANRKTVPNSKTTAANAVIRYDEKRK